MIETLLNHRSIRKFKQAPVEQEKLKRIMEAASRASTTGNMQVYSIVVTSDEEIKRQLWESHFRQDMVLQAPVHLTFCADFNRFTKWCRQRGADPGYDNFLSFLTGAIDALLAAQNAALAAEDQGLGICYLGTVTWMAHRFIEILELPQLVVPVAAFVLGYPDEQPDLTDRLPLEGIVHNEKYQDYQPTRIDQIYQPQEALPSTANLIIENDLESLAQIFTEKRYTRKDNRQFSRLFLEVLEKQGFMVNDGE
ncbi:MAG: nitroreductase family protein [Bacteroidales bacterium]|jgi:nitroreductase|nr:nitroreductase family protein [Bacteroidales bacterium]MDD3385366.1 nitroreductase family protein [Bacteroidales bacterium]MDD3812246.1 nitroreductase family protein [Bacteroidales bacterium]MDD3870524.1 nitroreductase family protein [Bacteroidales bacterium]MDD4812653.1 nitroreductase family protein [Bacteroidales bacterium]